MMDHEKCLYDDPHFRQNDCEHTLIVRKISVRDEILLIEISNNRFKHLIKLSLPLMSRKYVRQKVGNSNVSVAVFKLRIVEIMAANKAEKKKKKTYVLRVF